MVSGPTSPSQEPGWGKEVTEQSSGLLTNDFPSGEKQIKDVGRLSRENLHISYSLSPGSEDKASAGSLPSLLFL